MDTIDTQLLHFNKSDIFTPDKQSKLMASKLKNGGSLLEPSVGEGHLLKYIDYANYDCIDAYEIKINYLNKINNDKINKYNYDFIKTPINKKYDNIILNPPYIRIQDLSPEYRDYIKKEFPIIKSGSVDLYYAFILKCINLLNDNGIMVSITPNSYLYNKSSLKLKKYLFENRLISEIIDYNTEKVFDGVSVYCCITIFTKQKKDYLIYNNNKIYYDQIDTKEYNIFNTINKSCKQLKDICKIKNGIATLREKIYIHENKLFDEPCWKEITNCKNRKYIIFPYQDDGKIIEEDEFKSNNPQTYCYLLNNKTELSKRDKSNKTYPKWYAFGRTQSLIKSKKEKVLFISSFINPGDFNIEISSPILFYGGLCIEPINDEDVELIKKTIFANIDTLAKISSKRSGGWINISSRNLYELPLCN